MGITFLKIAQALPWWAYAAAGVGGFGFGILQVRLMKHALLGDKKKHGWIAVKFLLWAMVLAVGAMVSVPLLLTFAAVASAALSAGGVMEYRKSNRRAR